MGLVPCSCRTHNDCRPCDERTNARYFTSGETIASITSPYDVSGEISNADDGLAPGRDALDATTRKPATARIAIKIAIAEATLAAHHIGRVRTEADDGKRGDDSGTRAAGRVEPVRETVTGAMNR